MASVKADRTICRICLNTKYITLPLSSISKPISLTEKINFITSVRVQIGDKFPQRICMSCCNNLNIAYEFKTLCENSEQRLIDLYKDNSEATNELNNHSDGYSHLNIYESSDITIKKQETKLKYAKNESSLSFHEDKSKKNKPVEDSNVTKFEVMSQNKCPTMSKLFRNKQITFKKFKTNVRYVKNGSKPNVIKNKQVTPEKSKTNLRYVNNNSQPKLIKNFDPKYLIEEFPFKDLVKRMDHNENNNNYDDSERLPDGNVDDNKYVQENNIKSGKSCDAGDILYWEGEGRIINYDPKYIDQLTVSCKNIEENNAVIKGVVKEPINESAKTRYKHTICPICGKIFRNSNMKRHIEVFHERKRSYTCTVCQRTFPSKSYVRDHMNVHTGDKKFLCTLCGKTFVQVSGYRQHMNRHPEISNNKCTLCPRVFKSPGLLNDHMNVHNDVRKYGCKICQDHFYTKESLRAHSRVHKEKKQKCDICQKLFYSRNELKRHTLVHTGIKPYQCDICAAKFSQKSDMKNHILRHYKVTGTSSNKTKKPVKIAQYRITSNPSFVWQNG